MPKVCNYFDCDETIRSNHYLCRPHYDQEQEDEIDECGNCGQHKPSQYDLCLTCKREQPRSKKKPTRTKSKSKVAEPTPEYVVGALDPRPRKDDDTDFFYVYLLYLSDGSYYAGHTNDLGARYIEHTTGQTKSTNGKNPRLAWFNRFRTRDAAREHEKFLRQQCDTNKRAITRMIDEFLVLMDRVHDPRKTPVT